MTFLIGCDPEVFMRGPNGFVSAHGAIQGDKKNPFKVDKGAVQVDGMALEFNIDPAKNEEEFIGNIKTVMSILKDMVPGYELDASPSADFSAEIMAAMPPEALELGCEPDFNAWDKGKENPRPNAQAPFRTGAGHIHIGWTNGKSADDIRHRETCIELVKTLDICLGARFNHYDNDQRRRALYGSFGSFRYKPYGLEYRVLSNAWLKDEKIMGWVYRQVMRVLNRAKDGVTLNSYDLLSSQDTKMVLDNASKGLPFDVNVHHRLANWGLIEEYV